MHGPRNYFQSAFWSSSVLSLAVLVCSTSISASLPTFIQDFLASLDQIVVRSDNQKVMQYAGNRYIVVSGNAELSIGTQCHVWADVIVINPTTQVAYARARSGSTISIETSEIFFCAEELAISLATHTGFAKKIRLSMGGRYIRAEYAEKRASSGWVVYQASVTGCDAAVPHWSFRAKKIKLKSFLISLDSPAFCLNDTAVFGFPWLVVPALGQSKSGLMVPKFSIDKEYGLGITQAYYAVSPRSSVDTTIGIHWRQKHGLVFFNELRLARVGDRYGTLKTLYAHDWSKCCPPVRDRHRFWIEGDVASPLTVRDLSANLVASIDFGTDKRIMYDFFNQHSGVDDTFVNSVAVRLPIQGRHVLSLLNDYQRVERERTDRFCCPPRSIRQQAHTVRFGHLAYEHAYIALGPYVRFREQIFADHAHVSWCDPCCNFASDTWRLYYQAQLQGNVRGRWGVGLAEIAPQVQVRAQPAQARVRPTARIVYTLPQYTIFYPAGTVQCVTAALGWQYAMTVDNADWWRVDEYDHWYARNQLYGSMKSSWSHDAFSARCSVDQSYEMAPECQIFYLRRGLTSARWLPLKLNAGVSFPKGTFTGQVEYDWHCRSLAQCEVSCSMQIDKHACMLSLVHQVPGLQRARKLLSDVPLFAHVETTLALSESFQVQYGGYFVVSDSDGCSNEFFSQVTAPLQRVRLHYRGHCWSALAGVEYNKQFCAGKSRASVMYFATLRLDSFGGISKHFKHQPAILNAPAEF